MILATLFSFLVGYLARLRHRLRDQAMLKAMSDHDYSLSPQPPSVLVDDDQFKSAPADSYPSYIKREFVISLFLKLGVIFLFAGTVWFIAVVDLPSWAKTVIGLLTLIVFWTLLRVLESFGEIWRLTTWRGEFIAGGLVFLLLNFFTITTDTFTPAFTLFVVVALFAFYVTRLQATDLRWVIPALLSLALFQPLLLELDPSVGTSLYLLGLCLVTAWSLTKTNSQGTGLLLALGLIAHTLIASWYPPELISVSIVLLFGLAYLVTLFGLLALLFKAEKLPAWSVLSLVCWWAAAGFLFATWLPWSGLVFALMTLLFALLAYGWSGSMQSANTPIYLAGLATLSLLLTTAYLVSGFTLVSLYVVFVTVLVIIVTGFGLPRRVVYPSAVLYLIPLYLSLPAALSPLWTTGYWHAPAFNLYVLLLSLLGLSLWFLHRPSLAGFSWYGSLTLLFGGLFIIVGYVVMALVLNALFQPEAANVMFYVSSALLSLVLVYYTVRRRWSDILLVLLASTWLLPVYYSMASLSAERFGSVFDNLHVFGVSWVLALGLLIVLLLTQRNHLDYSPRLSRVIAGGSFLLVVYSFIILYVLVFGQVGQQTLATVVYANLVSVWLLFLYRLQKFLGFPEAWQTTTLVFLFVPAAGLFPFLFSRNFDYDFIFSPVSSGLLVFILTLVLLVRWLSRRLVGAEFSLFRTPLLAWRNLIGLLLIIFITGYTFTLLHSILPAVIATSLAFLSLGLGALYCFERGSERPYRQWRLLGAALLFSLVIQFLVFEVWSLPPAGRSVVAILFAVLFLLGAWYEKRALTTALR